MRKQVPMFLLRTYVELDCEWEDKHKTGSLWKAMQAGWLLYDAVFQFRNTDLEETRRRWIQILRAVR